MSKERQIQAEITIENILKLIDTMYDGGDVTHLAKMMLRNDLNQLILQVRNINLPYKEIDK